MYPDVSQVIRELINARPSWQLGYMIRNPRARTKPLLAQARKRIISYRSCEGDLIAALYKVSYDR